MKNSPRRALSSLFLQALFLAVPVAALCVAQICAAQSKLATPNPASDVLVLSNGDTLHGKFVSETAGKVTFHSDPLGDVTLGWDKIKELHVAGKFGVLNQPVAAGKKRQTVQFPTGSFDVEDNTLTVHTESAPTPELIPVAKAQYIMDSAALDKAINQEPGFLQAWNGSATAGATIVSATEDQFTFNGAVNLVRAIPTVNWLAARNKTIFGFNESYGKITQSAYGYPATPPSTGFIQVPAVTTKSSILHFGAERDQYFSPRIYALGLAAFDHSYSQDLELQQIYGGGIGWTASETPKSELDLKGTAQFEEQTFIPGTEGVNLSLIGSTFAANYVLHLKLATYTQSLAFIPAYNHPSAYSATEVDSLAFPVYKNFSFSAGTLDTYLNNVPFIGTASTPPSKPNSFQFTMGLTYAIKSKY